MPAEIELGVSWYLRNERVWSPRPWVMDRSTVEYPNISASGTSALISAVYCSTSMERTFPRREEISPIRSPRNSSGATTSRDMIGSSSTGQPSSSTPRLKAIDAAIVKAISEESTG